MITRYKNEDAFNATEDLLLVPVPVGRETKLEGFAGQVFGRFALAAVRLSEHSGTGLRPGETLIVGHLGREPRWEQPFSLALAAIHYRTESGWNSAPRHLALALDGLAKATERLDRVTLATAGIPGTGFSGLRGGAPTSEIKKVLDDHALEVTIYQDRLSGDRARLLTADPTSDDAEIRI